MTSHPIARTVIGWSLILAPLTGLVAAVALPALRDKRSAELSAIAQHSDRFYLYALLGLVSSYLLVPAFLGITGLVRQVSRWAYLAGGIALVGFLVAIGDAATELMYWQMGSPAADHGQMTALANRYESSAGSSLVYTVGGFAVLAGSVVLAAGLWRTRVVPRWAAACLAVAIVANVMGFSAASRPILIGSYVVLLAAGAGISRTFLSTAGTRTAGSTVRSAGPIPV